MCQYFYADTLYFKVMTFFYLDPQKRSFLTLSHIYAEPMTGSTHVRLFLYVSVKLTLFDILPGFRHRGVGSERSPLVPPTLLDNSM